jgi:hypothetical protein
MTWIYAFPTWLFVLLAVVVLSGGAAMVHIALRRNGWLGFHEHNDVTGFILTIVGAIYAVVLGFVSVVVWEQYEQSRQNEQHEVNLLTSLYALAEPLPAERRSALRGEIREYLNVVIDDEWPKMRSGGQSDLATRDAARIVSSVIDLQHDRSASPVTSEALSTARNFIDARRQRLQDNRSGIPWLLWVVLLGGGVITVGLGYLFGIENLRYHIMSTVCTTAIIALMLALIARLDYPYRGDSGISTTDFVAAMQSLTPPP